MLKETYNDIQKRNADKRKAKLRARWSVSKLTVKEFAAKHGVSRQRMECLLK